MASGLISLALSNYLLQAPWRYGLRSKFAYLSGNGVPHPFATHFLKYPPWLSVDRKLLHFRKLCAHSRYGTTSEPAQNSHVCIKDIIAEASEPRAVYPFVRSTQLLASTQYFTFDWVRLTLRVTVWLCNRVSAPSVPHFHLPATKHISHNPSTNCCDRIAQLLFRDPLHVVRRSTCSCGYIQGRTLKTRFPAGILISLNCRLPAHQCCAFNLSSHGSCHATQIKCCA